MNIIQEKEIELYNKKYKEITYEDGEIRLRRYNEKAKMWVNLKFAKEENPLIITNLINTVVNAL